MNTTIISMPGHGLYAITDCDNLLPADVLEKSETILRGGAALLQYRDKGTNIKDKAGLARELQQLCRQFNCPFIINDDLKLAHEIKADGIHLGQQDADIHTARDTLGPVIIGVSCYNNIDLAKKAQAAGADYVAFGAFFPSPTKPNAVHADQNLLKQAKQLLSLPIVAIGGITPENGGDLINNGADFLAVISGLYSAIDTAKATEAYVKLFEVVVS